MIKTGGTINTLFLSKGTRSLLEYSRPCKGRASSSSAAGASGMSAPLRRSGAGDGEAEPEPELSTYGLDGIPEGLTLPSLARPARMVGAVLGYFNGSPGTPLSPHPG